MNKLYLYANFGDWNKQPYGGGEVGNRRTLALLKSFSFQTIVIEKYKRVSDHSPLNIILLSFRIILNVLKYSAVLVFGQRKGSLVHIVGFYGPTLYFENVLVSIASGIGYKVVYEMRGGGADAYYEGGTERYRRTFSKLINRTICIFSQGRENFKLLDYVAPGKHVFYYPNFVMDDFLPIEYPAKPKDRINFLYFGRVSKTKNVDLVIDIFKNLSDRYENSYLQIVGNCPEPEYAKSIRDRINTLGLSGRVQVLPACNHEKLKQILTDKHFYIFPSKEPHEGHSNALTEAMAWGVIPVATSQGFNRSVIGNDNLIVKDLSVEGFSTTISTILESNRMDVLSREVYKRVKQNFTQSIVCEHLRQQYKRLFSASEISNH